MAKLEFVYSEKDDQPAGMETIEVRPWALAGTSKQHFSVHNGMNFDASTNMWVEIIYMVNGVQLFYTRNFLHLYGKPDTPSEYEDRLNRFLQSEWDSCGFGDMFPETSIVLKREKNTHGEEVSVWYTLRISADTGLLFNPDNGPGMRSIDIGFQFIDLETGVQFMRDLNREMYSVYDGKHPNPGVLPAHSSNWTFARQLNQKAYNIVSADYQEKYFDNPGFMAMFEKWLQSIPACGHILDAGCGHGDPIIAKLLEKEYRVTGIDLSPDMLVKARQNFPQVEFFNQAVTDLEQESAFDGACSLSSMLYLDPIDLYNGIHRLYHALKPGGTLFLYAYDLHPGWRGNPFGVELKQWMWSWTYSALEAANILEEHGYFDVVLAEDITPEKEKEERVEAWKKAQQEREGDKIVIDIPGFKLPPLPEIEISPNTVSQCYVIVARRK